MRKAEENLRKAVALDPQCADAHALMAFCILMGTFMGLGAPRSTLTEAAAAARRALDLNPRHPLALACAGIVIAALDWNWQEFERLMEQAYALAPNDPDVANWYAYWYLRLKGRYSEAIGIYDGIALRDPLAANWPAYQAGVAYHARDYAKAKSFILAALDIDGAQLLAQWLMCAIAAQTGDVEQALASGAEALRLSDGNDWVQGVFAKALAKAGRHGEALAVRDSLREAAKSRYVSPMAMISACFACGDSDGTLAAMEQLADDRSPNIFWLLDDPACDPVRRDPRCSALLARIGLPERY